MQYLDYVLNYTCWDINGHRNVPQTTIEAVQHCKDLLPNIKTRLQLFYTLSVTFETQEHTISNLKWIRTYLRSAIPEGKLNELALTNTNKEFL